MLLERRAMMFDKLVAPGYRAIPYVEFNGNNYIDLNIFKEYKFLIDLQLTRAAGSNNIFGRNMNLRRWCISTGTNQFAFITKQTNAWKYIDADLLARHVIIFDAPGGKVSVDGVETSIGAGSTYQDTASAFLGCQNRGNTRVNFAKGYVYSFIIYNTDGTARYTYKPAQRTSDGNNGLYVVETNAFKPLVDKV